MAKQKLIANRKMIYKTRHLQAGDRFEANAMDAVVLTQLRKSARIDYEAPVKEPLPQQQLPQAQPSEQVAAAMALGQLREEAEALGIKVDRRWAEVRLRQEIDKATEAAAEPVAEPAPAAPAEAVQEPEPAEQPAADEHAVPADTTSSSGLFTGWRG